MDLDAIEQRTNLTNKIRATIAKIDAKPWKRTDEERQQFEAEAIMRAHVGPALDTLTARVRELEEENTRLRVLVDDFTDPDPCHYDHHGYCQAHMWFATEPRCPHARARDIAKEDTTT